MNCPGCHTALPDGAIFCGECGRFVAAPRITRETVEDTRPSDTTVVEPLRRATEPLPEQPEQRPVDAASFLLAASTGERFTVSGGGLLGRRPAATEEEASLMLVALTDPEKSVSKTHLEFGVDQGQFWVCDRYSANGTIIHSSAGTWMCEPGRRYRVERGARLELGNQYVDIR